jgi:hypothetical protein
MPCTRRPIAALLSILVFVLLSFALAGTALAQGSRTEAGRLSDEAMTAYDEGRVDDAIVLLNQAFGLVPDPSFAFNLASLYEVQGQLGQAWRYYSTYLELFPGAEDRADVEAILAELRQELQQNWTELRLAGTPDTAVVTVTNVETGFVFTVEADWEGWVMPGETVVSLSAEGFVTAEERLNAIRGVVVPLRIELEPEAVVLVDPIPEPFEPVEPVQSAESRVDATGEEADPAEPFLPEPQPAPNRGRRIAAYSLMGGGVGLAGVGVFMMALGQGDVRDHNDLVSQIGMEPGITRDDLEALESSARGKTAAGIGLLAAGGVSVIIGTIMAIPQDSPVNSVGVSPLGRRGFMLSFGGTF